MAIAIRNCRLVRRPLGWALERVKHQERKGPKLSRGAGDSASRRVVSADGTRRLSKASRYFRHLGCRKDSRQSMCCVTEGLLSASCERFDGLSNADLDAVRWLNSPRTWSGFSFWLHEFSETNSPVSD